MKKFISDESGSALITTMIITVIITSTLLILTAYHSIQRKFINRKAEFLQAKYNAESGIYKTINKLQQEEFNYIGKNNTTQSLLVNTSDTVQVSYHPWGGFLYLQSKAKKKRQFYQLSTLVGKKQSSKFENALIINPQYSSLVVTGNTRIYGNTLTGNAGVKKGTIAGKPYTGDKIVYGSIVKSFEDQRPEISIEYIQTLFSNLRSNLSKNDFIDFEDIINDTSSSINLRNDFKKIFITNEQINRRDWNIRGPGVLVCDEPLIIQNDISIVNFVQIISSEKITINGGSSLKEIILYSPQKIKISNVNYFEGQLFSEAKIILEGNIKLEYPSIALVYSSTDTGSIKILGGSEISGSVIYLSNKEKIQQQNQGKIIIDNDATVNGLVYSDNFTTLNGKVNGTVITDRFYFYHSPTVYINWIKDGVIDRNKLNVNFRLPHFFSKNLTNLSPVYFK